MSGLFIAYAVIVFLAILAGFKRASKLSDAQYFGWLAGSILQLAMAVIPAVLL